LSDKPTSVAVLGPQGEDEFWTVEVIEEPEGDWIITNFHGVRADQRARAYASFLRSTAYAELAGPYENALKMIREAVELLFGPAANLPALEATGSEPTDQAEEIIVGLQRVAEHLPTAAGLADVAKGQHH
jgi:hypothetical protein